LSDLLLAIDYSKSFKYIGLVAAREHVIKRPSFLSIASWVKHVADLPKREKLAYLRRLPDRLSRIMSYLEYVRWFSSVESCSAFIDSITPAIVILDPRLDPYIRYPRKILEDRVSRRHEEILSLLADNVAYYAYWVLEVRKRPRELGKVLK